MKRALSLGIVLFATALAPPAFGQSNWSSSPAINNPVSTAATSQQSPRIASDGAGGAIMAWIDFRNNATSGEDVYAQRMDANGNPVWTLDGIPVCTAPNNQGAVHIVGDGAGGAIIVWHDARNGSGTDDIYAQRVDANGNMLWSPNGVVISAAANQQVLNAEQSEIIGDGSGGAIITWSDNRGGVGTNDVYAQKVNASGAVQWTADGVAISTAAGEQNGPVLIGDGAGGAIIAWEDTRSGLEDVYAQRIDFTGTVLWTANGVAIATVADTQKQVDIESDGAGGAIIVWEDNRVGGLNHDIYAQRVNPSGAVQWTVNGAPICTATGQQGGYPHMISDGAGGAVIAWQDTRNGGTNYDVYAQRVDGSGTVLWVTDGVAICAAANNQQGPRLTPDGAGGAVITWQDYRANGANTDIYAQRINATGSALWALNGVAVSTAANDQWPGGLVGDASGNVIIAWYDLRNGIDYDVYAQKLLSDGTLPADTTPPVAGAVNDGPGADIDFQTSTTTINANWSGFSDAESGIAQYEWAIGTTPGGATLQAFTSVATATSATNSALTLTVGSTYYVTVRATNGAGLTVTATSDGVTVNNPGWAGTGGLGTARWDHTATLLPNGKVLIVGGKPGPTAICELFDLSTGTWTPTGSLAEARYLHTAVLLQNGKVLVAGGVGGDGVNTTATCELYDPANGAWTPTGSLSQTRWKQTATVLNDGKVLVAGGQISTGLVAGCELYDPSTGTWSPTSSLTVSRHSQTATLLPNGKVLATGGLDGADTALSSCELYDPALGTWSAVGPLANARQEHTAVLLTTGKVLVAGGRPGNETTSLGVCELFDPAGGTWSLTGSMSGVRYLHTATLLPSGMVLITGGSHNFASLGTCEAYDQGIGTWSAASALGSVRSEHTATLLPSGKVFIVGGTPDGASGLATAELFDPALGRWSQTGTFGNTPVRENSSTTLLPNGKVLVVGNSNPSPSVACELYDPSTGTWGPTGPLNIARSASAVVLLPNGKVLLAGGQDGVGALASCEIYDSATGTWGLTGTMAAPRRNFAAVVLRDGRVLAISDTEASAVACELFDPATGTWSPTGSMVNARGRPAVVLLSDGRVLAVGDDGLGTAELYDPLPGIWGLTNPPAAIRSQATLTRLPNGKVLLTSDGTAACELYDPSTGSWSTTGSMSVVHFAHATTLLPNGTVLVTEDGPSVVEIYDPATGAWRTTVSFSGSGYHRTATLLPSADVLLAGGVALNPYSELYTDSNAQSGWKPAILSVNGSSVFPKTVPPGTAISVAGSVFRGISEASGGATNASATNMPIVRLVSFPRGATWGPLSSGAGPQWTLPATGWAAGTAFNVTLPPASETPDGYYLLYVIVNGIVGEGKVLKIDGTPPAVTVIAPIAGQIFAGGASTTIAWTATDASGVASNVAIQYSTDGGTTFPNVVAASTPNTGTYAWTVPPENSALVRVRVQATDAAGNVGSGQSPNFTIDSAPPDTTITSRPPAITNSTSATFAFTATETATFQRSLDGGAFVAVTSPETLTGLSAGSHSYQVRAIDPAGNADPTPATYTWTIDTTPPVAGIVNDGTGADISVQASTTTLSANWSGFSDPESGIIDYIYMIGTTPGGGQVHGWTDVVLATSFTEGGLTLANGVTYYVTVQAYNGAILTTVVSSNGVTVDSTPPAVTLSAPAGGEFLVQGTTFAIAWTSTDATSGVASVDLHYSTDGGATFPNAIATAQPNTGTFAWTVPAVASSTVRVRVTARDAAGNAAAAASAGNFTIEPPLAVTTTALAGGTAGVPYSQTLSATGGTPPYTWSVVSGALPAGLTLNPSTGVLSGTPSVTGTTAVIVQVADGHAAYHAASQSLSIAVGFSAPAVVTTSLPNGTQGASYSAGLAGAGGAPPYVWSVSAGALPPGLSLNGSTGAIAGTPTANGTFAFTVLAADSQTPPATATQALSILVNPPLAIVGTAALSNAYLTKPYSATIPVSGGQGSYTFNITSGALPAGLSLNSFTGAVTGQATATGSSTFTVQATDSTPGGAATASAALTLPVFAVEPPVNLSAISANGQADLSWDPVLGAATYKVYYGSASSGVYDGIDALQAASPVGGIVLNSVTLTGLSNTKTYFIAVSAADALAREGPRSLEITAKPLPAGVKSQTRVMTGGTLPADFRMIGWPVLPSNQNPIANLSDDLGPYDPSVWRLFKWNALMQANEETATTGAGSHKIAPGEGFWILTRQSASLNVTGSLADATKDFTIVLQPGWNLFGHPWDFPVDVALCRADGVPLLDPANVKTRQSVWDFNGSYLAIGQLVSGRAYWLKNLTAGPVTLAIPPAPALAKAGVGVLSVSKPTSAEDIRRLNPDEELPPPPPSGGGLSVFSSPPMLKGGSGGGGGGCWAGAVSGSAMTVRTAVVTAILLMMGAWAVRRRRRAVLL